MIVADCGPGRTIEGLQEELGQRLEPTTIPSSALPNHDYVANSDSIEVLLRIFEWRSLGVRGAEIRALDFRRRIVLPHDLKEDQLGNRPAWVQEDRGV